MPEPAGESEALQIVQETHARAASLTLEKTARDKKLGRLNDDMYSMVRDQVLAREAKTPRPAHRPPTADTPVEAQLCIQAVSVARDRLESEKQTLCELATCVESRSPGDPCLLRAPDRAAICQ